MMVDLKVMAYFKISLSTRNWDRAFFMAFDAARVMCLSTSLFLFHLLLFVAPYDTLLAAAAPSSRLTARCFSGSSWYKPSQQSHSCRIVSG
jgi:hypothetical protein